MRKASLLAALGALSLTATPLAAQETATSEQNLDCALWASIGVEAVDGNAQAFILAVGYFIGLYEAQTGQSIDDAMVARAASITQGDLSALDETCGTRLTQFGMRLGQIGQRINGAAEQ